jgi:hypothetical protein
VDINVPSGPFQGLIEVIICPAALNASHKGIPDFVGYGCGPIAEFELSNL